MPNWTYFEAFVARDEYSLDSADLSYISILTETWAWVQNCHFASDSESMFSMVIWLKSEKFEIFYRLNCIACMWNSISCETFLVISIRSSFNLTMCPFKVFNVYLISSANEITNRVVPRQNPKMHMTANVWLTNVTYSMKPTIEYPIGCFVLTGYLGNKRTKTSWKWTYQSEGAMCSIDSNWGTHMSQLPRWIR